jgi:simple sugar transport system ATP-binding protein
MRGISRRFGSVQALRGADFSCASGEVYTLLGENGAGKSTLMRVVYGMVRPDGSVIEVSGRSVRFLSPHEAMDAGIGMVHQHFTQVPVLTVAENVWPGRGGLRYDAAAARWAVAAVPPRSWC